MARARNIKPGFFKNEDLADLGPFVQLLFAGLWTLADREGRLEDRPRRIKAEIFPHYDMDVNGGLTLLHRAGFVRRYKVNGVALIHIVEFKKHQSPHNTEKQSELPGPEFADRDSPTENSDKTMPCANNGGITLDSRKSNDGNQPDSLIPDSSNTDSLNRNPESIGSANGSAIAPGKKSGKSKPEVDTSEAWQAYAQAYRDRYKVDPVRNATVNTQMVNFVKRLGAEAPAVAIFYLAHSKAWYVQQAHCIGAMLSDAEALRTQWATGNRLTSTKAQQADRTQTNGDVFGKLIAEADQREMQGAENAG